MQRGNNRREEKQRQRQKILARSARKQFFDVEWVSRSRLHLRKVLPSVGFEERPPFVAAVGPRGIIDEDDASGNARSC